MTNRRRVRVGLKVIHRHRIGRHTLRRVSELVFVQDQPKAVLAWIDMGGDRVPVYLELDARRLRTPRGVKGIFYYDGVTTDPRFVELEDAPPSAATRRR
jgi:hypothetical protein